MKINSKVILGIATGVLAVLSIIWFFFIDIYTPPGYEEDKQKFDKQRWAVNRIDPKDIYDIIVETFFPAPETVYGQNAKNGLVKVWTKRGSKRSRTEVMNKKI